MEKLKQYTMLEIEMIASNADVTPSEFMYSVWIMLGAKGRRKTIHNICRHFNIYPSIANAYQAVKDEIFAGIAMADHELQY